MIIKFDHISFITQQENIDGVLEQFGTNYKLHFKEIGKDNLFEKRKLMYEKQEKHDLYFLNGELPIEVIAYPVIHEGKKINVDVGNRIIYAESNDFLICTDILKCIGVNEIAQDGNILNCNLKGIFDKEDYWLNIILKKDARAVYLDDRGFGCITFLVDNIDQIRKQLCEKKGVDLFTAPELMVVNGRRLKISFLRLSVLDIIFEFITPDKHTFI